MDKLFVVSDIHSFYTPLKKALDESGFDPSNENHWLICCGDAFDRGTESVAVLHFLMGLERKVLIRGNHDVMLEECCLRGYAKSHDISNGTVQTIRDFGAGCCSSQEEFLAVAYEKLAGYRAALVNYFETEKYIFVHGWIPCERIIGDTSSPLGMRRVFEYDPAWRNCNDVEWEDAMWLNGIERAQDGIIEPGKTIVCGHWHCSLGHFYDAEDIWTATEFGEGAKWDPWYHEGCIAIDRCTALTGEVNVLVIEDEFLE